MSGDYSIGSSKWPGLSKLIEECGEVLQCAGKLIATDGAVEHWDQHREPAPLDERLCRELADLQAAVMFVIESNGLDYEQIIAWRERKLARFRKWHEEQDE